MPGIRIVAAVCALLMPVLLPAGQAWSQCILANPSFELPGSGGGVFGGWSQFGAVGQAPAAVHGSAAARVSGPDYGGWDVSGFWQRLDSEPGEQWAVTVLVQHSLTDPLTGLSKAIVNIEWRDAGGGLIGYESHTAADAATPAGEYAPYSVVSGPAPAGTAATHFLLGVLQAPGEPVPDVYYDQATFFSLQYPTMDVLQWNDFPGGRTLDFGGRSWRVKGDGYYGPGPNLFADDPAAVWVDGEGRLHLTIRKLGSSWYSTEVALQEALGYGDYIFTTVGRLDLIDPQAVFGLFLWQYGPCYDQAYLWWNPYDEIDVEFSRWGNPAAGIGQFVTQPYDYPGNIDRFDAAFAEGELTSHAFRWLPDRVEYRSWRGGPFAETAGDLIRTWTYTGPHIPRPEQPRVHLNLWKLGGTPAGDQEVVLDGFVFVPVGTVSPVGEMPAGERPGGPAGRLYPAAPNPFNPSTTIRYTLAHDRTVELAVFGLDGRLLRTLPGGFRRAGDHQATWDGRDDAGRPLASGTYLCRLRGEDFAQTQRVVLLK